MEINKKVALVTGAARGTGEAIAGKLPAGGCLAVITDIS